MSTSSPEQLQEMKEAHSRLKAFVETTTKTLRTEAFKYMYRNNMPSNEYVMFCVRGCKPDECGYEDALAPLPWEEHTSATSETYYLAPAPFRTCYQLLRDLPTLEQTLIEIPPPDRLKFIVMEPPHMWSLFVLPLHDMPLN